MCLALDSRTACLCRRTLPCRFCAVAVFDRKCGEICKGPLTCVPGYDDGVGNVSEAGFDMHDGPSQYLEGGLQVRRAAYFETKQTPHQTGWVLLAQQNSPRRIPQPQKIIWRPSLFVKIGNQ